jgi:TonB-linked SusC/RagA family outer membrane protein
MIKFYLKKKKTKPLFYVVGIMFFLLCFTNTPMLAQSNLQNKHLITGTVVSGDNNAPLPGVNVYVKGTTAGTITDANGKYSIQVTPGTTLVYSFIGYDKKEVKVGAETIINVTLQPSSQMLKETVVIGYGAIKKSSVSGSISKISDAGDKLGTIPVSRTDKALMGQIAGLQVQNTDAQAGAAPKITLRGVSSINTSSSPLIVVDGYPIPDDLSSIDMSNVASIQVLKDAASAAIYGSRASNGVIIVTTKKGVAGKTQFHFNSFVGFQQPYPTDPIYSTPQQWADFAKTDAAANGLQVPDQIPTMLDLGTHTDWEDLALRNAAIQNYKLSTSGGSKNVKFYIGLGYQNNDGIVETNNYKQYNLNATIDANMNKWLTVGMNMNTLYSKQRVAAVGFHDAIRSAPWLPLYMTDETIGFAHAAGYSNVSVGDFAAERYFTNVNGVNLKLSSDNNGYVKLHGRYRYYYKYRAAVNFYAGIKFSNNFKFRTSIGGYYKNNNSDYYQAAWSYRKNYAYGYHGGYQTLNWINENTLTYHKLIGKNDITGLAGFSVQSNQNKDAYMKVQDFLTDYIHTLNAGTNIIDAYTSLSKNTLVSTFYRLNYSYANKYILAASIRWDASSRFGKNNKWGAFPAVSAAWRIDQENFLKNSNWISQLKLRASFGATGNNNIGDYSSLAVVKPGYDAVFGNSAITPGFATTSIANPYLSWEKTYQFDAGFDFGILKGRIFMSFDYYDSKTHQLLLKKEIPSVTGFTSTWANMGKVQNKGYEFEITSRNIVSNNFKWTVSANWYTNQNKLLDLGGASQIISTPDSKRPSQFIAEIGSPITQFYGYVVDYSKGDNGEVPRSQMASPYWPIDVSSAYVYVKDINGDGVITDADRVPLGSPYPKFNWAITNNFTFGNFDLSFMFQGSEGAKVYNIDSYYYGSQWKGSYASNVTDPQFLQKKIVTDWNVQNASFVALRNLMVGYSLPKKVVDNMHLAGFKVYFTSYNLLYIMAKGYTGLNPEGVNRYDKSPLTFGYQRGALPVMRSFTLGLDIKF